MSNDLIKQYMNHTLEHNKTPESVYLFAKAVGMDEKEFYNHYSSLESLEADIYKIWFENAFSACADSAPWTDYSSREKVLAVFFAYIEEAKNYRSFAVYLKNRDLVKLPRWPKYLNELHTVFTDKMKPVLSEGISTNEIQERKYLDEKYVSGLWLNFLFVFAFWLNDNSKSFEKTDESIERSVNLAFDLMGKSALDAALDFGKFLFQNR
jgi:hypothetical protein